MNCLEEYLKIFEQYPLNDKRLKKERKVLELVVCNEKKLDKDCRVCVM